MAAPVKVPTIFTAIDKFSPVTMKMTNSMNTFAGKVEWGTTRASMALNKLTPSIGETAKELIEFSGVAAVAFELRRQFENIQNFETGLVAVGKTADIAGQDLTKFGQDVINMSNELRSISTDKLLELSSVAGQLGVKGTDNILTFSKTLSQLELASDVVGEEGAKSIARILNITGEGIGTVDQFAASLVGLGNNSAASEMEILDMANEVSRATAPFGLASTEILGISAALTSLGSKPEAAGTSVGKLFTQLESSINNGGSDLAAFSKVLNLPAQQIENLFATDKNKLFVRFAQGLERVKGEGGSVVETLNNLGLTGERTLKGLGPLANNSKLVAEALKLSSEEYANNTALQIEAQKASNTLAAAVKSVRIAFDNIIAQASLQNDTFSSLKNILFFVAENMTTIVKVGYNLLKVFLFLKASIAAFNTVMFIKNTYLGINTFLMKANKRAIIGNTVATNAYRGMVVLARAATIGWNVVTGIVTGSLLTMKFTLLGITAPVWAIVAAFGAVVSILASVWRNWEMIKKGFTEGGILGGITAIVKVLIDAVLAPLQTLLELASNIPGVGDLAGRGANRIFELRESLDLNADAPEINNQADRDRTITEKLEKTTSGNLNINLNDPGGMVQSQETSGNIPIEITSTMSQY